MMMTMMMMMKTPSWWVTRIWCTCVGGGEHEVPPLLSKVCSVLSAHCASARNCSSYVPPLLSRVCFSDSHLSRVSLLTVPLLSTAEQSLLLLCCYVPPLLSRPTQLEKKKATVESNLELPRLGFTKWFDIHSFPKLPACCPSEPEPEPTWTQLEHFSHVGGVGGAVHNRGGGILHFSFAIQTDGRVVFFHNPEQAMASCTFLS